MLRYSVTSPHPHSPAPHSLLRLAFPQVERLSQPSHQGQSLLVRGWGQEETDWDLLFFWLWCSQGP